jgi:hypothetical protein
MNKEFNVKKFKNATVYTLESASGGGTSAGAVASVSSPMGGVRKRGDNLIAQEEKKEAPKPRNFVAKNAKMGGAGQHKDKKKAEKQGDVKHRKPFAEQGVAEGSEQVYKVIAVDKSNYLGGKEEMTVKADSIEDLFSRLSANDWYPLEINGVEVVAGKRLKQGVAEGRVLHRDLKSWTDDAKSQGLNVIKPKNDIEWTHHATDKTGKVCGKFCTTNVPQNSRGFIHKQGVAEGLPQTLRKVVPGYAKREIDKKMDAGKFGKTDADKDANFQRYKKIQDKLKEQGVAEDHEIQMASSELQSIAKNAVNLLSLVRKYSEKDGLEAWQQSKITKAADYLNAVLQSVSGEQTNLEGYGSNRGYQQGFASPTAPSLGQRHRDRDSGDDEPQGMFTVVIDGRPWKEFTSNKAFQVAKTIATKHPDKLVQVKWPNGQLNTVKEDHSTATQGYGQSGYDTYAGGNHGRGVAEGDAYMEQLAAKVAEKLDPNAPTDVWVQDFQKANPNKYHQFKNKTPAKKAQMAVAAHYAANEPSKKK